MPASNLLLASKVVVTEEPPSIRNIPGVPTAIAAFEGVTQRGPMRVPQFITSFADYVALYGGYLAASDLPIALEAAFRNGLTAAWVSRLQHYTDPTNNATGTSQQGTQTLQDRGATPAPAKQVSATEPFAFLPTQHLDVKIDGAANLITTFNATPAQVNTQNETFPLSDLMTFQYQVKNPGSTVLGPVRTIIFHTADFTAIGAATAAELDAVFARDGIGFSSAIVVTHVRLSTDKKGSDAQFVVTGGTGLAALGITAGTFSGTGNVADIDAVLATEIAALITALPILPVGATAVALNGKLTITGVTTGPSGSVVILGTTTALGVFAGSLPITTVGTATAQLPTMTVLGKDPGTYINPYAVVIEPATSGESTRFNFRVKLGTATSEVWPNLSMDPLDARYFESIINTNSKLVSVVDLFDVVASPNNRPAEGSFTAWSGANDGLVGITDADYAGNEAGQTGLYAFDQIDNITLLAVPGRSTSAVHNAMITYCEVQRVGLVFAVLDPPAGLSASQMVNYVKNTAGIQGLSERAAIYWPRVKILNPDPTTFGVTEGNQLVVPPSGTMIGVYARTDASRPGGVYLPPAGIENGLLLGVLGFETDEVLNERKRDLVYPELINPLNTDQGSPRMADGDRTLKSDGNFPTIAERRGVIFIEASLKKGLLFAKHRNNDRRLRMEVKRTIDAFLLRQFDVQAFRGDTPKESFFTDVSDAVNPIEVIFAGELHAKIGLATQKPAEFIVLTFTQDTRQLEERLASALGS